MGYEFSYSDCKFRLYMVNSSTTISRRSKKVFKILVCKKTVSKMFENVSGV